MNPVTTSQNRSLQLVQKWDLIKRYRWSSLGGYLRARDEEDFVDYRWLGVLASSRKRAAYARYIRQFLGEEDDMLSEAMGASAYAIGDEAFRREVAEWMRADAGRRASRSDVELPEEEAVALDAIVEQVASAFGIGAADLLRPRRRVGAARGVFVELACTLGRQSQRQVAGFLGTMGEHGVSKQRRELQLRLRADKALQSRVAMIEYTLKSKL